VTPVEFRGDLWLQKLESLGGLSCGVVCVILYLAVLVELQLVMASSTDAVKIKEVNHRKKVNQVNLKKLAAKQK